MQASLSSLKRISKSECFTRFDATFVHNTHFILVLCHRCRPLDSASFREQKRVLLLGSFQLLLRPFEFAGKAYTFVCSDRPCVLLSKEQRIWYFRRPDIVSSSATQVGVLAQRAQHDARQHTEYPSRVFLPRASLLRNDPRPRRRQSGRASFCPCLQLRLSSAPTHVLVTIRVTYLCLFLYL